MTVANRIDISLNVMLGKPVIRGTRIPVEVVLRKLSEGASEADLLAAYRTSRAKTSTRPFDLRNDATSD